MKKQDPKMSRMLGLSVMALLLLCSPFSISEARAAGQTVVDPTNNGYLSGTVWANRLSNWSDSLDWMSDNIDAMDAVNDAVDDWLGILDDQSKTNASAIVSAFQALSATDTALMQALMDGNAMNALDGARFRHNLEHGILPYNEMACKTALTSQAVMTTLPRKAKSKHQIMSLMTNLYRSPTDDGAGYLYARDMEELRCANRFGSRQDGYPESCVDDSTSGDPANRRFTDADLSAWTLDGSVTLERPNMRQETVLLLSGDTETVEIPDPDPAVPEQRFWLAAVYYCVQVMGPRPSPLRDEQLTNPKGQGQRAVYDHAFSIQSAMNETCADLVSYYERPNPSESDVLAAQNEKCEAARGIIGEETIRDLFANCERGLSQYQAEYLKAMECKMDGYATNKAQIGGKTLDKVTQEDLLCTVNWDLWKTSVLARNAKLVDAVMGHQKNKKNWPRSKGQAASIEDLEGMPYRVSVTPKAGAGPQKKTAQKIKAVQPEDSRPSQAKGLPKAVAQ